VKATGGISRQKFQRRKQTKDDSRGCNIFDGETDFFLNRFFREIIFPKMPLKIRETAEEVCYEADTRVNGNAEVEQGGLEIRVTG
jgi:hypothetical protein